MSAYELVLSISNDIGERYEGPFDFPILFLELVAKLFVFSCKFTYYTLPFTFWVATPLLLDAGNSFYISTSFLSYNSNLLWWVRTVLSFFISNGSRVIGTVRSWLPPRQRRRRRRHREEPLRVPPPSANYYQYRFPLPKAQVEYLDIKTGKQPFIAPDTLHQFNHHFKQKYPASWLVPLRLASAKFWSERLWRRSKRSRERLRRKEENFLNMVTQYKPTWGDWAWKVWTRCPLGRRLAYGPEELGLAKEAELAEKEAHYTNLYKSAKGRDPDIENKLKSKEERDREARDKAPDYSLVLSNAQLKWSVNAAARLRRGSAVYDSPILDCFKDEWDVAYADEDHIRRVVNRSSKLSFASLAWDRAIEGQTPPFQGSLPEIDGEWAQDWYQGNETKRQQESRMNSQPKQSIHVQRTRSPPPSVLSRPLGQRNRGYSPRSNF